MLYNMSHIIWVNRTFFGCRNDRQNHILGIYIIQRSRIFMYAVLV